MWNEIRDRAWGDRLTVVGVSISTPYEHKTFVEERGMDSRLFSDPTNEVGREYGIPNPMDGMAGIEEPRPAVFLLDDDRTVQYAWVASEWPDFPDYDEVEAAIDSLV
jgi:peroxiredoxin